MKTFIFNILCFILLTIISDFKLYSTSAQTFIYKTDKFEIILLINRGDQKAAVNDFLTSIDTCLPYIIGIDSSSCNLSSFYHISLYNWTQNNWIIEVNVDSSNIYRNLDTFNTVDVFEKRIFPIMNLKPKKISNINIYKLRFKETFTFDEIHNDDISNLYIYSSLKDFTMFMYGDFGCQFLWATPATKSQYYLEIGLFRTENEAKKASYSVVVNPNDVDIISMNIVCKEFHKLFQFKL